MASLIGDVVQESSVGWNTNTYKGPRKGLISGRTPLGDLSNSLKQTLDQASKKHNSSIIPLYEKEPGASNSLNAAKKKNINALPSKKQKPTGRKALSDISNSGKPILNVDLKKSSYAKLRVLAEEPIDASEVAEEQFLHNHLQCIKANSKAMGLDLFLQTLGLDNDLSKQQQSSPMPYQSPPRHFQLEEMAEELIIEHEIWKHKFSRELDSPPLVRSPKHFMDYDCKFELLGSP